MTLPPELFAPALRRRIVPAFEPEDEEDASEKEREECFAIDALSTHFLLFRPFQLE